MYTEGEVSIINHYRNTFNFMAAIVSKQVKENKPRFDRANALHCFYDEKNDKLENI